MKPNGDRPKTPDAKGAKDDLKTRPMPQLQAKLESSPDDLTEAEAQRRLTQYGPNEIAERKTNPFLKFLTYFWGPIPWMIEVAVILSGVVRHWPDFFIILLLPVSNAVAGFWEERQAGGAIAALKAKLAVKAKRFEPIYQYRLWGGRRLAGLLAAPLPDDGRVGEAWVLSDREDHASRVADGPLKGLSIAQLLEHFPQQIMGELTGRFRRFPLLLKFLDARCHAFTEICRLWLAGQVCRPCWCVSPARERSGTAAPLLPSEKATYFCYRRQLERVHFGRAAWLRCWKSRYRNEEAHCVRFRRHPGRK